MDTNQLSDTEGSIGASRLKISSTPASPSSDEDANASISREDSPPAYEDVAQPFSGPPGNVQLEIIKELKNGQLEAGDSWNLVSRIWYRRWITACSGTAETKEDDASISVEEVGPIDNSSLVVDGQLRKPLSEGVDLELVPSAAYGMLKDWYVVAFILGELFTVQGANLSGYVYRYGSNGPDFERTVVSQGGFGSERVEFFPPTFQIFLLCPSDSSSTSPVSIPNLETAPTVSLASSSPFSALHRFASEAFSLGRPTRLWRLPEAGDPVSASEGPAFVLADKLKESGVELLELPEDTTLDEGLLSDPETRIAVEQQKPDGTWLVDSEAILAAIQAGTPAPSTRATTPSGDVPAPEKKASKGIFAGGWSSTLNKPKSNGNLAGVATQASSNANAKASGSSSGGGLISSITGALTRSKTGQAKAGHKGLVGLSNLGK